MKVNQQKSQVGSPLKLKFLGFSLYKTGKKAGIRPHGKSIKRFKDKIRELTSRKQARSVAEMNEDGADLYTAAMIKFENGVRAAFNVGMILGENTNDRMDRLYIRGEKGCIKSSVEYNQEGELSYTVIADGKEITRSVTARQNYCLELERMNKAITGTEEILVTPEFSIRNAKLIDEALKAIGY